MQMANLAGDKSWPGRRGGTFQLFLSAAFVLAVRTRGPSDGCPWRCRQPGCPSASPIPSPTDFASKFALSAAGGRRRLLFHAHYGNRSLRPRTRPCCSTVASWSPPTHSPSFHSEGASLTANSATVTTGSIISKCKSTMPIWALTYFLVVRGSPSCHARTTRANCYDYLIMKWPILD